jgi:methyl-accepting chemotaxis protein WspA
MRWFSRLTLKLFLSFLLMLFLMAAQGLFALSRIHEVQQKTNEIVTNWSPSVRLVREMQVNLMLHGSFDLRHALTDDPALMSDLERQMQERLIRYKENEREFSRLIDSSEEKRLFDDFREKLDQYLARHERFLELSRRNNLPEIRQWVEGEPLKLRLALEGALDKLVGYSVQGELKADQEGRALVASTSGWVLGLLLVGVGLGALCALASTRAILNPLTRALRLATTVAEGNLTDHIEVTGSDEVGQLLRALQDMRDRLRALITKIQQAGIQIATSSTEISASVRQQEATVSEQATSSSQIAASTKEISVTTKEFSKGMDEVVRIAEDTARLATDGQERLSRIDHSIEQMVAASNAIASKLALLNDKADNINTVLATVTKVADQTNLLSINAAIEAEKAGEYGRGFSVVADRDPATGRPDRRRFARHRADAEGNPFRSGRRGHGHGQILRRDPPQRRRDPRDGAAIEQHHCSGGVACTAL